VKDEAMAVTALNLRVDAATFQRWNSALANLQRQVSVPLEVVGSLPAFPAPPNTVAVTGLELLLEVGVACARPGSMDDPARLFGLFRYATALSTSATWLALNQGIGPLDRHKKGVLSDEFGCGMACLVTRQLVGATHFLDVSDAVRRGWVRTFAPQSRQPDYVGAVDGSATLVILEAKGSQGSRQYCRRKQIPSGCGQVSRVRPTAGGVVVGPRLVVSTLLQRENQASQSTIFLGDPEEFEAYDYDFRGDVRQLCARHHVLRVAALIGDGSLAQGLATTDAAPQGAPRDSESLARHTIDGDVFVGSELHISDGKREAGLFVGLGERTRRAASHFKFEFDEAQSVPASPERRRAQIAHDAPGRMAVVGRDGVAMEVWTA
jgi:hypothetical protein